MLINPMTRMLNALLDIIGVINKIRLVSKKACFSFRIEIVLLYNIV
jgi:hypothetical protein